FSIIRDQTVGNAGSLVLAAAVGGLYALLVGIPLIRLSGLAAGIATFAVREITQNIVRNWEKIGPGPLTLSTVPETTDLWQATLGTRMVVVAEFMATVVVFVPRGLTGGREFSLRQFATALWRAGGTPHP